MTVYIFGDSYGAISSRGKRYRAWFDMIEEPIVNKCKGSASPYYCLRRLNEEIDNITENDKIVFIMGDKTRVDFPSVFILASSDWKDIYPFFIILYLKYISQKKKCNVIVFSAFESIKFDLKFLDPFYFNSNDFKVFDFDLFRISQEEFIDEKYSQEIEEKRRCHLSYENHVVLFNIISNFFYDTSRSEIFHKNLYKTEGKKLEKFIYN